MGAPFATLQRDADWCLNDKRVDRLWRQEGLNVPMKQLPKGTALLNKGCVHLALAKSPQSCLTSLFCPSLNLP